MSRIAPDIPELRHVPDAVRSLVYMRALNAAIRSPLTWLIGAIVLGVGVGAGASSGGALLGTIGLVFGAAAGACASIACFFKLILPWRARRFVPAAVDQTSGGIFDQVQQTDERVKRMVEAHKRRDRQ